MNCHLRSYVGKSLLWAGLQCLAFQNWLLVFAPTTKVSKYQWYGQFCQASQLSIVLTFLQEKKEAIFQVPCSVTNNLLGKWWQPQVSRFIVNLRKTFHNFLSLSIASVLDNNKRAPTQDTTWLYSCVELVQNLLESLMMMIQYHKSQLFCIVYHLPHVNLPVLLATKAELSEPLMLPS